MLRPSRSRPRTGLLVLALGLALTVSACGSNDPEVVLGGTSPAPSVAPSPIAAVDNLTGVDTSVLLDQRFLAGLAALKLTPTTTGRATLEGTRLRVPITGGNVTYYDPASGVAPFVTGQIEHQGSGLGLTGPGGKLVELADFVIDPATSTLSGQVSVDGSVLAPSAPLFFLDGRTLQPLATGTEPGTAVLAGTTVSLTKAAADALNGAFGTTALTEHFPVGVAEITLKTAA